MDNKILVNVLMITYGHEKYIKQSIEGVLMQKGDFNLKLIIANDCSPDGTDEIIKEIIKTHSNATAIEYINNKKNLGIMPNFLNAYSHCKGEYVAFCEGDDYWTDPLKLQKQLALFKENINLGLVYTGLKSYHEQSNKFSDDILNFVSDEDLVIPTLLKAKYIDFCTVMIKRTLLSDVLQTLNQELLNNAIIGDTRIILDCAYKSKIGFIPEVTTVYRVVEGSASHPVDLNKSIATSMDTYNCRKFFINRYLLDKRMLGTALCNYNKVLITKSYQEINYFRILKLLSNLKIKDYFSYCTLKTFRERTSFKIILKLVLSLTAVSIIKNRI